MKLKSTPPGALGQPCVSPYRVYAALFFSSSFQVAVFQMNHYTCHLMHVATAQKKKNQTESWSSCVKVYYLKQKLFYSVQKWIGCWCHNHKCYIIKQKDVYGTNHMSGTPQAAVCHALGLGHSALFSFVSHVICAILHDRCVCPERTLTWTLTWMQRMSPSLPRASHCCSSVLTFVVQINATQLISFTCTKTSKDQVKVWQKKSHRLRYVRHASC